MIGTPPASVHPRPSRMLVGRADLVALLRRRWDASSGGTGHVLLIAGEAGIGKTRLLAELVAMAAEEGRVLRANAFPRDEEFAGALLLDLAAELRRAGNSAGAAAIRQCLTDDGPSTDASDHTTEGGMRRRRRIVDLADRLTDIFTETRTLLVLEDLHWADELSLEVVARVAGHLASVGGMLAASYRSDELFAKTALARIRGALLDQRRAEEIRPGRLGPDAIAELINSIVGSVPSAALRASVLARSDGIPLHIEELIAARTPDAVPETVAEAVVERVGRLAPEIQAIAAAASVVGRSFSREFLARASSRSMDAVDDALEVLLARHLVEELGDGVYGFRHELICDAIYLDIPARHRRALHAAVAAAATAAGLHHSYLSHHFEHAGDAPQAYAHARAGAREASQLSAHREAAELLTRARRTEDQSTSSTERARLRAELAVELAAIDDNEASERELVSAIDLYRTSGSAHAAAVLTPALASVRHLLGAPIAARAALLVGALDDVDSSASDADTVRAHLLAALAAAYMLDRRLDESIAYGRRASQLISGDDTAGLGADLAATLGCVEVFAGHDAAGWDLFEDAIREGTASGAEASTARAFRIAGSTASVVVEYIRARRTIAAGLEFTERTERWNDHHYLTGHLAHVLWATGEWDAARAAAQRALADGRGGITTRSIAITTLGYLALGGGDMPAAHAHLDEAAAIGVQMGELQRLSPALWGLAELAMAEGEVETAVGLCKRGLEDSATVGDAAYLFPFVLTGVRAFLAARARSDAEAYLERSAAIIRYRAIPGTLPVLDHAEGLIAVATGDLRQGAVRLSTAVEGWSGRERVWELMHARLDLVDCLSRLRRSGEAASHARTAHQVAVAVGARGIVERAEQALSATSGPRSTLSAREREVARLIAAGSTNRQIAEQLVISPKTASSHVEHILAKLGLARRTEIAAWIARQP